jgi:hypothetical protein
MLCMPQKHSWLSYNATSFAFSVLSMTSGSRSGSEVGADVLVDVDALMSCMVLL